MEIKSDLHCHGPEKWRGRKRWNPIDISNLASGKLDVLAITEMGHEDNRFEELKLASREYEKSGRVLISDNEIYVPENRVLIVRTQEVACHEYVNPNNWRDRKNAQGHLLVVGAKKRINWASIEGVLDKAGEQGAGVIADHSHSGPHEGFLGLCYAQGEEKVLEYFRAGKIHAIEDSGLMASRVFFNFYFGLNDSNERALDFALKNKLKVVANTDSHSAREMDRRKEQKAYSSFEGYCPDFRNYVEVIVEALKNDGQKITAYGKKAPKFSADIHALRIAYIIARDRFLKR